MATLQRVYNVNSMSIRPGMMLSQPSEEAEPAEEPQDVHFDTSVSITEDDPLSTEETPQEEIILEGEDTPFDDDLTEEETPFEVVPPLPKEVAITTRDAIRKERLAAQAKALADNPDIPTSVFNNQCVRATVLLAPFGLDLGTEIPGLPPYAGSLAYGLDDQGLYYSDEVLWNKLATTADLPTITIGNFQTDPNPQGLSVATTGALRLHAADILNPGGISAVDQSFGGLKNFFRVTSGNDTSCRFGIAAMNDPDGAANTALGNESMSNNSSEASYNTAVGAEALYSLIDGDNNVGVGFLALGGLTTGSDNVVVGSGSMTNATTAINNVIVGNASGQGISTGQNNVIVGHILGTNAITNNNTLINCDAVTGDADTNRIGRITSTKTFLHGITGRTVTGTGVGVVVDQFGQLGESSNSSFSGSITWTGAITPNVSTAYTIERLGRSIIVTFTQGLNPGTQAAGILTNTVAVGANYRPTADRFGTMFVINSSASGGTPTNAVVLGNVYLTSTGFFQIGIGTNNSAVLTPFGGSGSTGSGNGFLPCTLVFGI